MALAKFTLFTVIGCVVWCAALCSLGYSLGSSYNHVLKAFSFAGYVLGVLAVIAVAAVIWHRLREYRRQRFDLLERTETEGLNTAGPWTSGGRSRGVARGGQELGGVMARGYSSPRPVPSRARPTPGRPGPSPQPPAAGCWPPASHRHRTSAIVRGFGKPAERDPARLGRNIGPMAESRTDDARAMTTPAAARPPRVLMAKVGLDAHDRGLHPS